MRRILQLKLSNAAKEVLSNDSKLSSILKTHDFATTFRFHPDGYKTFKAGFVHVLPPQVNEYFCRLDGVLVLRYKVVGKKESGEMIDQTTKICINLSNSEAYIENDKHGKPSEVAIFALRDLESGITARYSHFIENEPSIRASVIRPLDPKCFATVRMKPLDIKLNGEPTEFSFYEDEWYRFDKSLSFDLTIPLEQAKYSSFAEISKKLQGLFKIAPFADVICPEFRPYKIR